MEGGGSLLPSVDGGFGPVLVVAALVRGGVGGGTLAAALPLLVLDAALSAERQVELR